MKLESEFARVWKASGDLRRVIPRSVPIYRRNEMLSVDIVKHNKRSFLISYGVDWHTDWSEVFNLVVASGKGTFSISSKSTVEGSDCPIVEKPVSISVERGDIIQFWAMTAHKLTCRGTMSFIQTEQNNFNPNTKFECFSSQEDTEKMLIGRYQRKLR